MDVALKTEQAQGLCGTDFPAAMGNSAMPSIVTSTEEEEHASDLQPHEAFTLDANTKNFFKDFHHDILPQQAAKQVVDLESQENCEQGPKESWEQEFGLSVSKPGRNMEKLGVATTQETTSPMSPVRPPSLSESSDEEGKWDMFLDTAQQCFKTAIPAKLRENGHEAEDGAADHDLDIESNTGGLISGMLLTQETLCLPN